jgi:hypothetical protein
MNYEAPHYVIFVHTRFLLPLLSSPNILNTSILEALNIVYALIYGEKPGFPLTEKNRYNYNFSVSVILIRSALRELWAPEKV